MISLDDDNYIDAAERALSSKAEKQSRSTEKNKLPPVLILTGAVVVLIVVIAIQFLFPGSNEITEPVIQPEALEQFEGQLEVFADMINNYRNVKGFLPETEEDFIGHDDPVITYIVTGPDSYRLEYFFLDSTLVLEKILTPITVPVNTPHPGAGPPPGQPGEAFIHSQ